MLPVVPRSILILLFPLVLAAALTFTPASAPDAGSPAWPVRPVALHAQDAVATEEEARQACGGACHRYPPPDILPRGMWRDTIARMFLISQGQPEPTGPTGTAGRLVQLPPEMQRVLRFYMANAPAALPPPTPWPAADASRFVRRTFSPPDPPPGPAISHVRFMDLDGDGRLAIVATDMRYGLVLAGDPRSASGRLEVLGSVPHPARAELFDLDGDGVQDLLVADLGQFLPQDHTDGSVVWMRGEGRRRFSQFSLEDWPRVADVRAADFNGDGKPDLVVGAFGWRKVGHVSVLENRTVTYPKVEFHPHVIDPRPGAVHVIPVDLNGDGHMDIVALISQQYETVMAYINTGKDFVFTPHEIYTAPHPNWGSSGIQLVDLDGDADLDVLFTHGDTFDDSLIKPYHGIMWLENKGTYPFTPHHLADLPGAFRAEAADMDGDGDLDIVACAFIAGGAGDIDESEMPALVWLEQVKPGVFERRTLERRAPRHATLHLADMDGDGDIDIVVGTFMTESVDAPWVEVWENQTRK
jgi:hypothetical protein